MAFRFESAGLTVAGLGFPRQRVWGNGEKGRTWRDRHRHATLTAVNPIFKPGMIRVR